MSNQATYGIAITADDRTAKGVRSAERRVGGITKRAATSAAKQARESERSFNASGRGIIRTFLDVERASTAALGPGKVSGSGGIIARMIAVRQAGAAAAGGLGEAAVSGGLLTRSLLGLAGPAGIVAGLAATAFKIADGFGKGANSIGHMASLIGVSTKGLQEFAGAAERVGVDKATATSAIGGLSSTLNDARYGRNTGALATLGRLGVAMKTKADGNVDVEAMLPAIADALSRQTSAGRRLAAGNLGISDAALPVFTQGGRALRADMADFGRVGATYSDADVAQGRKLVRRDAKLMEQKDVLLMGGQRLAADGVETAGDAITSAWDRMNGTRRGAVTKRGISMPDVTPHVVVRGKRLRGGVLRLSSADVTNMEKLVETEWSQPAGPAQGRGIIDTVLNRVAAGRWGNSVESVANARSQFSDINGRPAWQKGRHSIGQYPYSKVSDATRRLVRGHLRAREMGAPSTVGDNLNYANPYTSDARNRNGWIRDLQGPRLGSGIRVHQHGTTPDLQSSRPGAFKVDSPIPVTVTVKLEGKWPNGTSAHATAGRGPAPAISRAYPHRE